MKMISAESPRLENCIACAALFHALEKLTRLARVGHLGSGEHRVRDLVDHMHLAQSTVSKHLACLRDCGLVRVRVEGRASGFSLSLPDHHGHDRLIPRELTRADAEAVWSSPGPSRATVWRKPSWTTTPMGERASVTRSSTRTALKARSEGSSTTAAARSTR